MIIFTRYSIRIIKNLRPFSISASNNGQERVMNKIMQGGKKRKFKYCDSPILPTPHSFSKGAFEGKKSVNVRRVAVLNKLFMRYITDLMASGACSSAFVGHSIEVNRVQITPDFKCVNVFWIARGTEKDDVIEELLHKNAGSLRHELAQLKVVGCIPQIKFIQDKQYACAVEVVRILSQIDFGEDYTPTDLTAKLKTQLELNTSLEPHQIQKIAMLEKEIINEYEDEPLPLMPQTVFNLNYAEIMERIQKSTKKSQALHRLQPEDASYPQTINENPVQFINAQQERAAFKEFLRNREILKNKAKKVNKNFSPEYEVLHEEWLEQQKLQMMSQPSLNFEESVYDRDVIEED